MAKGKYGEGSVFQRKDGRWVAQIKLESGKKKQTYHQSEKDAHVARRKMLHELEQGVLATGPQQTLKVYLTHWIEHVHRSSVAARTYLNYRAVLNNHIIPSLGHIKLQKLTPQHVQAFYAEMIQQGLKAKSVNRFHTILHKALDNAVRWGLVSRNVCDLVTKLREERFEIQPLTEEQAKKLLKTVQGDMLEGIITVTLSLGLRRGEALGLKWQDIDFEAKCLYIQHSTGRVGKMGVKDMDPKSAAGRRKINLPNFVVDKLQEHKARQLQSKERLAEKWVNSGYVFTNKHGGFLQESELYTMYKRLLQRAELPNIRFHDLRHSAATIMLSMGVNPKVIQEVLGHSNISITLGIYSHVLPSMQQDMTQKLDGLFNDEV